MFEVRLYDAIPTTPVQSDRWSLAEVRCHSVAVEPRRNDLEHMHRSASNQFQGPKIKTTLASQRHYQYKMALELPPTSEPGSTTHFLVYRILCKQLRYEFPNRYSCCLPSASFMLFLPALLFFVLGTGTSVLAVGSESSDPFMSVAITSGRDSGGSGMDKEMDYERAQGYWRLEVRTKHGSRRLKN